MRVLLKELKPVIALVLMVTLLGACSSDDTYLPALLADPMADYSHPDLEEEARAEIPQGESFFGGSAERDAHVFTSFVLTGSAEVALEDLITFAEDAGWKFEPDEPIVGSDGHRTWTAEKELEVGLAGMSVNLPPMGPGGDQGLTIRLLYREEY